MNARRDRFVTVDRSSGAHVWVQCPTCSESFRMLLHYDAKTAPGVKVERSGRAVATVPNAFPLPVGSPDVGGSCPGVTSSCRDCYAAGTELLSSAFGRGASGNLDALQHLERCGTVRGAVDRVAGALLAVVRQSERLQQVDGVKAPCFRWHSSGDIYSAVYARAIRRVMVQTPGVDHWIYTRSLSLVRWLVPVVDNARVLLSADSDNLDEVARTSERYGLPVAMLGADRAQLASLWGRLAAGVDASAHGAPVLCPVVGKWAGDGRDVPAHVVGFDGRRSTAVRGGAGVGACVACSACLPGSPSRHISFTVHGGRARGESGGRLGGAVRVRLSRRETVTA